MRATISCACGFRCGLKIDARAYPDIVVMAIEEAARGPPAVGVQHLEEIVISVKPFGGVQRLRRAGECNPVHVDAPILSRACATRQLALIDQFTNERDPAQL